MTKAETAAIAPTTQTGVSPVTRPSLPYMYAFDLCALEVQRQNKPVVLLASNAFFAYELAKRLAGVETTLVIAPDDAESYASRVAWGEMETSPRLAHALSELAGAAPVIVWAQPHPATLDRVLHALADGGALLLIVPGRLGRFLPEARITGTGGASIERHLRQAGLRINARYGFHGASSIAWSYAARAFTQIGRYDLADRYRFKMRNAFCVQGWQARFASVRLVISGK